MPMSIQTKDDWFKLAGETLPELQAYMRSFGVGLVDFEKAPIALLENDWQTLYKLFSFCWNALPDSPHIHVHPFANICDLCSEIWVFEEEGERE